MLSLHPKLLKFLTKHPKPLSSTIIGTELQLSRSQVSYLLRSAERNGQIVRIGQGKNTRYLATIDQPMSLYQINEQGKSSEIAELILISRGSYVIKTKSKPSPFWLMGENALGYFDDLPYFLDDLRPQGFLGRRIARQLVQTGKYFPSDPCHWTKQHILEYLQQGTDFSGNLLLGQTARQHCDQKLSTLQPISPTDYPAQANAELSGTTSISSSAAGEQPKFTAFTEQGHSIIKFSCLDTIVGQRWADLLIAEHIALQHLARLKLDTANTRLHTIDNYVFLESIRFDRHGAYGRSPLLSGTAVDAEFVGAGTTWLDTAKGLFRQKLITNTDYQAVLIAHCFGRWIGNTDMHLGNISWIPEETQFRLAPIYDMTPMLYAPLENNLPPPQLPRPLHTPTEAEIYPEVIETARQFWQQLVERKDISTAFKAICCDILKHWSI